MDKIVVPICITVIVLGFFYILVNGGNSKRSADAQIAVACLSAGGSWLHSWRGPYCERGKP